VPQTLEANIPLDDDGNAAFSGMQSIPEEEETGRFVRDMTFDFDAGSGGSAPDPAVEGEEKLPNFGFGQDGPLGFGEGVPPTEEIPTAVLEDLASPHYASMSLPESPEIEGFGSFGHDASDFDDLEEAPQRTDYTVVVIVGSALVIGVILSWFMLN